MEADSLEPTTDDPIAAPVAEELDRAGDPYAWYVLAVLTAIYSLSWMDRTVLSILAEDLKARFAFSDAELGFLHGTAFGVFYAIFGYPLGRLADRWNRVRLLSICITLWSAMTLCCGLAASTGQLVAARIGVAVGEASCTPSSYSLLSDWFPRNRRGTALGVFSTGFYLGQALALAIGGLVLYHWTSTFGRFGPFGLQGWQVTFLIVGLPGVAAALLMSTLHEPARGLSDGTPQPTEVNIWRRFLDDVASVIPPFTFLQAARCGWRSLAVNLAAALALAVLGWVLIRASGDVMQWVALGLGGYAAFSSVQMLRNRDPATFALTWRTPAYVYTMLGFGFASMLTLNMGFWTAPLALRSLPVDKATVGVVLGITAAVCGMGGVFLGGRLSDMLLRRYPAGRIYVGLASAVIPVPFVIGMCATHDPWVFFALNIPVVFLGIMWMAAGAATIQELVLPRMRGTASVNYFMASTLLGSAVGPYWVGKVSAARGDLATGVLAGLVAVPIAVIALWMASRRIQRAEASKVERAQSAGELIEPTPFGASPRTERLQLQGVAS